MKTPLTESQKKFDLKFMVVGNSGVGKTHFAATYTQGPVHFYMIDPGGEKSLFKVLANRPTNSPITIDTFNPRNLTYGDFWNQLRKDEKEGFFSEIASLNGLVVLPDSLTAINDMLIQEIARINGRDPMSQDKAKCFRIQDWGQVTTWTKALVSVIHSLPCAVMATAHLYTEMDSDGTITGRYPNITGQYRANIGKDFDEVYLLEERQNKRILYASNYNYFQAKTRTMQFTKLEGVTMDLLYNSYMKGEQMK